MRLVDLVADAYQRCAHAWAKALQALREIRAVAPGLDEYVMGDLSALAIDLAQSAEEALGYALGVDYRLAARQAEAVIELAKEVGDFSVWGRVCEGLVAAPTWAPIRFSFVSGWCHGKGNEQDRRKS